MRNKFGLIHDRQALQLPVPAGDDFCGAAFGLKRPIKGLHNGPHAADVGPGDRYTQPAVRRTPAPRTDEEIRALGLDQVGVELTQFRSYGRRSGRIERFGLDV